MEISLSKRMKELECKLEMQENHIRNSGWKNERNVNFGTFWSHVPEYEIKEKIDQLKQKIADLRKENAALEPILATRW